MAVRSRALRARHREAADRSGIGRRPVPAQPGAARSAGSGGATPRDVRCSGSHRRAQPQPSQMPHCDGQRGQAQRRRHGVNILARHGTRVRSMSGRCRPGCAACWRSSTGAPRGPGCMARWRAAWRERLVLIRQQPQPHHRMVGRAGLQRCGAARGLSAGAAHRGRARCGMGRRRRGAGASRAGCRRAAGPAAPTRRRRRRAAAAPAAPSWSGPTWCCMRWPIRRRCSRAGTPHCSPRAS